MLVCTAASIYTTNTRRTVESQTMSFYAKIGIRNEFRSVFVAVRSAILFTRNAFDSILNLGLILSVCVSNSNV